MSKRESDWRLPYPDKYITGHYGTMSDFRRKNGMQAHSGPIGLDLWHENPCHR
jgi:hypothetical protein